MRDEKRIEKILDSIGRIWKRNPDQRFGQLLINLGVIKDSSQSWSREDNELEDFLNGIENRNKGKI